MVEPNFATIFKKTSKPHKFCPGCGHPVVLSMLARAIEELGIQKKVVFLVDIGCSLLAWDFFDLPTSQTHHGRTVPVAVGLKMADPDKIVIAYVGDGGAYAIGLSHTITSCLRNDPITTVVVNNTVYGMTGGQMAPTTTTGEKTTTTPGGKESGVGTIKGPELLAGLGVKSAYLARGTMMQPLILKQYLTKALENQIKGHYSLVEALSCCPVNWKTNAVETIAQTKSLEKTFPVGEFNK